jgi:PIN domain nuclease of toxin-antitoxin system
MSEGLLLDTCAIIFIANKAKIRPAAESALRVALEGEQIWLSPISAWELGMVISTGRLRSTIGPLEFFENFVDKSAAHSTVLSPRIMVAATYLPLLAHKDPFDRLLIATAREHDLTLVTSDRAILDYGAAGHVKTLAC